MRALSAAELFDVWERGQGHTPARRALLLLALACEETPIEELGRFGIGRRDAELLSLRKQVFGPELVSTVICPACAEQLEFRLQADDLYGTPSEERNVPAAVSEAGCEILFRLPTSLDLASLARHADPATNREELLKRCVVSAKRGGVAIEASQLPDAAVTAIAQRMSELDPQANLQLKLACPQCEHAWQAPLDIVSYFWWEIHGWGQRILREIHLLASAYGWREADILALSAWRRHAYLELIES